MNNETQNNMKLFSYMALWFGAAVSMAEILLKEVKMAVVRGNMSEIKILSGLNVEIKGVDSIADDADGVEIATKLSKQLSCVVAITGAVDIIAEGDKFCLINNGNKILSKVTGTGCMSTSLIGTYLGAAEDCFVATVAGVLTMGLAGELANNSLKEEEGIGTFRARLFDEVFKMNGDTIMLGGKISYE